MVEIDADAGLTPTGPATILLHKPVHVAFAGSGALVTPETHARIDPSGWRIQVRHFDGLTSLMPLDADASGLVVLSQDARVCRRLTVDAAQLEQEFMVEVVGASGTDTLSRHARGRRHRGRAVPAGDESVGVARCLMRADSSQSMLQGQAGARRQKSRR